MKKIIILILLISAIWSQCDANNDGDLNVVDIVIQVDCILEDCWDSEPENVCEDIDGNVYETVLIGNQLWMAENLKVTHYNNGEAIPTGYSSFEWFNLAVTETGAYAIYDDNPANAEIYGNLYNWYTIDDDRGVCPEGWHVPTDDEFKELEIFLGMSELDANSQGFRGTNEGSKLAGNADLWYNPSVIINNAEFGTSGFNALPSGYRYYENGNYYGIGNYGYFWSSSEGNSYSAWNRILDYSSTSVSRDAFYGKTSGFSVRCLRD